GDDMHMRQLPSPPAFTPPRRSTTTAIKSALFIFVLSLVMGVAVVRAPVSHADPSPCYVKQIGHTYESLNMEIIGNLEVWLYARYKSFDGSYCGTMFARAVLYLNPGAPWGHLWVAVHNCASGAVLVSAQRSVNGGGDHGTTYPPLDTASTT